MTKEVTAMRERIASIKRELVGLRSGDVIVSKAAALARVDQFIAEQIAEGGRYVEVFIAQQMQLDPGASPALFPSHRADAVRIALAPEPIRAALHAEIERQYTRTDSDGIEPGAAPARIATLEAELLALEKREYAAAIKAGIDPRHDTAPAVLLGIA